MRPTKNWIYCPQAKRSKIQFRSREKALNFIRYNSNDIELEKGMAPIRAYYCDECCCWHVTSRVEEQRYSKTECEMHYLRRKASQKMAGMKRHASEVERQRLIREQRACRRARLLQRERELMQKETRLLHELLTLANQRIDLIHYYADCNLVA